MTALDTSSLVAYLAGESARDTDAADAAIAHRIAVLPPVVITELLSAPNLGASVRQTLLDLPVLDIRNGYWERAGLLRGRIHARGNPQSTRAGGNHRKAITRHVSCRHRALLFGFNCFNPVGVERAAGYAGA